MVPLRVLASHTVGWSLARIIGGKDVQAECLIKHGYRAQDFSVAAGDVSAIERSDLLLLNGLGLEAQWGLPEDVMQGRTVKTVVLGALVPEGQLIKVAGPGGGVDPHIWTDPSLVALMAEAVGKALGEVRPERAEEFTKRAHEVKVRLESNLKRSLSELQTLPSKSKYLFTTHDTMGYLARTLGIETRSLVAGNEKVASQLPAELKGWLTDNKVKTLFREHTTNKEVLRTLMRESQINPDPVIYGLSLAPPGTAERIGSMSLQPDDCVEVCRYNADLIIRTLLTN